MLMTSVFIELQCNARFSRCTGDIFETKLKRLVSFKRRKVWGTGDKLQQTIIIIMVKDNNY